MTHVESLANAILGIAIAQLVLWVWGVPLHEAVGLNATLFGISYVRAYALRTIFRRLQ